MTKTQLQARMRRGFAAALRATGETGSLLRSGATVWTGTLSLQPDFSRRVAATGGQGGTTDLAAPYAAYLPYVAMPKPGDKLSWGGRIYAQVTAPANVGGMNVYWQLFLGEAL